MSVIHCCPHLRFQFRVDKKKLEAAEWRDGHYLLRSNLTAGGGTTLGNRE
jgi:hypothetical protein